MNEIDKILQEGFEAFIEEISYKFDFILSKRGTAIEYQKDLKELEEKLTSNMSEDNKSLFEEYKTTFTDLKFEHNKEYLKFGIKVVFNMLD